MFPQLPQVHIAQLNQSDWRPKRPFPATQQNSLPYRLHDEANDHGQTYTATHHSYYYSCDFTCRGKTHRGVTDGGKKTSQKNTQLSIGVIVCSISRTENQMQSYQKRAPSLILQQMKKKKKYMRNITFYFSPFCHTLICWFISAESAVQRNVLSSQSCCL